MTSIASKIANVPQKLWEHKKKTAFGCFLLYLGGNYAAHTHRNSLIRAQYAKLAVKYGEQTISAEDRPRRVAVLANVTANERSCFDDFTKNALPLLNLAGIQVDIIKSESEKQLEALAAALDHQEADAIYIVGGDGTIGHAITGILNNKEQAPLPIGVFPGGYHNLTLRRFVPNIFASCNDVRRFCESAMELIEDVRTPVRAFQFQKIDEADQELIYGLGDVGAGWFRHIENKSKKLWYFGSLKRRWAYIWEMIKRSPKGMEVRLEYQEHCSGCQNCKTPVIIEPPPWRWWHLLTGSPKIQQTRQEKDYSHIENLNCGRWYETTVLGTDLLLENVQNKDDSHLLVRMGGKDSSRLSVIAEGMKRCSADIVGYSEDDAFYTSLLVGDRIKLQFDRISDFISKLYVSGELIEIKEGDSIVVSKTDRTLSLFLPSSFRVDINAI